MRRAMLNSFTKPCSVVSSLGVRKGFSPTMAFRSIDVSQKLRYSSISPKVTSGTVWKPLNDPEANKESLKRVIPICAIVGVSVLIAAYGAYTVLFPAYPKPKRE